MKLWAWSCCVVLGVFDLGACEAVKALPLDAGDGAPDAIDAREGGDDADGPPPVTEFLSCIGLASTCGADGRDNCCNSPQVLGNTFFRSFDRAGDATSGTTSFPATISDFRLDKYEVSVGRFRAFINAGMGTQANPPALRAGTHPNLQASGWDPSWNVNLPVNKAALLEQLSPARCASVAPQTVMWTEQPGSHENRPINCVSWFEAMAFCIWDGGYLPTEAEWNFAATGGTEYRAFPWSVPPESLAIDAQRATFFDGLGCVISGQDPCLEIDVIPVGSLPMGNGRYGQSDMGGNVAEWTLDYVGAYQSMCTDCANLAPAAHRQIRGGGFGNGRTFLRTGFRHGQPPTDATPLTGFRCARPAVQSP